MADIFKASSKVHEHSAPHFAANHPLERTHFSYTIRFFTSDSSHELKYISLDEVSGSLNHPHLALSGHEALLHCLNVLQRHLGFKLPYEHTTTFSQFRGMFFSHSEPVKGGMLIFFNATTFKIGQPRDKLSRNPPFFGGLEINLEARGVARGI